MNNNRYKMVKKTNEFFIKNFKKDLKKNMEITMEDFKKN